MNYELNTKILNTYTKYQNLHNLCNRNFQNQLPK